MSSLIPISVGLGDPRSFIRSTLQQTTQLPQGVVDTIVAYLPTATADETISETLSSRMQKASINDFSSEAFAKEAANAAQNPGIQKAFVAKTKERLSMLALQDKLVTDQVVNSALKQFFTTSIKPLLFKEGYQFLDPVLTDYLHCAVGRAFISYRNYHLPPMKFEGKTVVFYTMTLNALSRELYKKYLEALQEAGVESFIDSIIFRFYCVNHELIQQQLIEIMDELLLPLSTRERTILFEVTRTEGWGSDAEDAHRYCTNAFHSYVQHEQQLTRWKIDNRVWWDEYIEFPEQA